MTNRLRFHLTTAVLILAIGCADVSRRPERVGQAPTSTLAKAYELIKADRPDEAVEVLTEILREDPANRQARRELAYLQVRSKRWKEAVILFSTLLDADPSDMRLRMELGYARRATGDYTAALDEFSIVARQPNEFQDQAREAMKVLAIESSPAARDVSANALLNEAYDDLRRGEKAAAREKFMKVLREDPGKTQISKQLGYMNVADGNLTAAAEEFAGVHRLAPRDYQTALELGYIYDSLHDEAGAKKSFAAALPSPDPKVHAAAADALKKYKSMSDPVYLDFYASPFYTSRFKDRIAYFEGRVGYKPARAGPVSFYFATRYTQDSRSRSGTVPEIYSDNAVSFGPGIRIQPKGLNVSLSGEWGADVNLLRSSEHPDGTERNGRVVLSDYHYFGGPGRTFIDVGGSVGYYSRYRDNIIGYLQLRGGVKAWSNQISQLSVYAPVNVLRDRNRDFFNNVAEIGAGLEFQPSTKMNLKARAEYLYGVYMGIEGRDRNPYGPRYDDLRVTLIYSAHFTRRRKPEVFKRTTRRALLW